MKACLTCMYSLFLPKVSFRPRANTYRHLPSNMRQLEKCANTMSNLNGNVSMNCKVAEFNSQSSDKLIMINLPSINGKLDHN